MKRFAIVTLLISAAPSWAAEIYNFSLLPANGQIQALPEQRSVGATCSKTKAPTIGSFRLVSATIPSSSVRR